MTDPRIKRPCPFCGETVHLTIQDGAWPFPIVVGKDTVRRADGLEEYEEVDAVYCEVCTAGAPIATWNGEQPDHILAVMRDFDPTEDGSCGCGHDRHLFLAKQEAA
ncbi:hypothetical protein [Caulobacter sp. 602-1]|uniref:hypothetical protein n=1 Tax=Caulobacter sp. 602-1 TaxID=2492472 RepID=UPI000F6442D6|nr:hypothetical protein [Caulobacter sp. 602-1]RRN64673.1 hypothetical protein EIK80_11600 [Caulobacter sp. 602-1]